MKALQLLLSAKALLLLSSCLATLTTDPWALDYLPELRLGPSQRARAAVAANPDWSAAVKAAVLNGSVQTGMTKAQTLAAWGAPSRRNVDSGRFSREQWVYTDHRGIGLNYLYFGETGLLEHVQQR